MKRVFLIGLVLFFCTEQTAVAQLKLPQVSSAQTITQGLGIGKVTLSYSRPNVNKRTIFGGLVPYDKVWRTGANTLTSMSFDKDVSIAGQSVPAGKYGLLTIPNEHSWTVILSKNSDQWGAYTYDPSEDLIRFDVEVKELRESVETLTLFFSDVTTQSTNLNLIWDKTHVSFPITVDQDEEIMRSIAKAMNGEKKPYFAAAQYYYRTDKDIQQAVQWMTEAEKLTPDAPHVKYWQALILLKAGDKAGAIAAAEKSIALAEAIQNEEYVKLNTELIKRIQ